MFLLGQKLNHKIVTKYTTLIKIICRFLLSTFQETDTYFFQVTLLTYKKLLRLNSFPLRKNLKTLFPYTTLPTVAIMTIDVNKQMPITFTQRY